MNNKKLYVWLPVIIAFSIALGIFIGNYYLNISSQNKGMRRYATGNKVNYILDIINEQYVDTVEVGQLVEGVIPKIFSELDPHSVYIPAEDAESVNEELEGSFSGIGVSFNMQTDTILVISVIPGGPSEKAGLQPFDRIITINDSVFSGKHVDQNYVMKNLRGAKNSTVTLGVKRRDMPELIYFDVTRGDVPVYSVDVSYEVKKNIGYIKISKFARTTYNEFITAIAKLKQEGCNSFVVDLRGNSGGMMDAAINMINEFLPAGQLIVYTEGKAYPRNDIFSNGTGTCIDNPLVVLTDEGSASASEIFAGAIQDNDRGMIIGRRTYGKGLVQSQIALTDGSQLRLTIARYYTPSGRSIQKEYQMGKTEDYDMDIYNRFLHGEFYSADSIKIDNLPEFTTSIGRTVYGGGGIMPDIFIPSDTSGVTSYFNNIVRSTNVLYLFTLLYSDENYNKLSSFDNYEELYSYLKQQPLLAEFTDFAAARGVKKRPALINISAKLIETHIHAYIVRNFFEDSGFYPIFYKDDETIKQAVKVIEEGKSLPTLDDKMSEHGITASKKTPAAIFSLYKERIHGNYVA
ncbi:carboxyl-terminal processing protease [Parabacteroides sp. PF5-5]|uniref:S41 family peptidase n=1 Tax=unclassified Parabacteroides TaxID=2649774 RepID=UPI002476A7EC|nr:MULTISPECIES: S41 family peptidase [unclassified Parabacteroides]MDH6306394.1 carboxyl-terminal processing protease [Parabacteroides sp. PH5-39]MDH6314666.1 carboxyl-terminal processing protease [Parabacteroides sp. PF5-13]MDH6321105.1 carboxyl-terminal processing protease [Parabacteroides sp. PH5-13]MDH6324837.1 carboxyl-terminal processing protease [Parabacteroides sp. PH5-8]MDH6325482.1 carboxyl-terminal processing protease [Parabacteroides sp. PH5-41]